MASTSKEKPEEKKWSTEEEIQLFFALEGLRPVGVNRHFYMVCIADRLATSLKREISAEAIWAHLRTLYNLEVLDEMEPLPFPNAETDFCLPDTEFSDLMSRKMAESEEKKMDEKPSTSKISAPPPKDTDKKASAKATETPKRTGKRTRGSVSLESSSPSTTPPPSTSKRRRI